MRAQTLSDLLKRGDRVAVSNVTGREASKVCAVSQKYCGNIVGGWALGKGGQFLETSAGEIPVYATFDELLGMMPPERHPNKILIYSPPEAVYGEVKEVVNYGEKCVETIYIITEHVSIEVTAKIHQICAEANVDVIGCNTLGIINTHDEVRIGAVGGDSPEETFKPGSITVISNSGNMVNTISSYLLAAGMGNAFGISTGKDRLILLPLKDYLLLAEQDPGTRIIVLYVEPGGTYEHDAIAMMRKNGFSKPIVVYVAGEIADRHCISLGHAGAVVECRKGSAGEKKKAFDEFFGIEPFRIDRHYKKTRDLSEALMRGIRVQALHHIPRAVTLIANTLAMKKDFGTSKPLRLNPWFVSLGELGKLLPPELTPASGVIPEPYVSQISLQMETFLRGMIRQPMRNASHASSNDGAIPRIYGYSLADIMEKKSLMSAVILYWTGELPRDEFEVRLAEMTLIASLSNGPGTISAQGAKCSASAGNSPNTAMIATLATLGEVHGGNGARAVRYLLDYFRSLDIYDPYAECPQVRELALRAASEFKNRKLQAKEAGTEYERIPCLGHPVFRNDPVNNDPREQVIYRFIRESGRTNIFLEFYHFLVQFLKDNGSTSKVLAVNLDAAIACVWLGICWRQIREKQMTVTRAVDIPFIAFALGRAAGGAGEFLDHQDHGTEMDMRIPVSECKALTRPRKL
jgi:succinyl-CoA synthetase alpha subunit/citrate synthase